MTALRLTGSVRRRARAAGLPAPRRPRFSRAARPLPPNLPPLTAEPLEPRRLLATFVVTTTADAGPGSLRQAILDANAAPGQDRITFAIGDETEPVYRIRPLSPLPEVTDQTGISAYEFDPVQPPPPRIELDGSAAGPDADGLVFRGRYSGVTGLAIFGFSRHGVVAREGAGISIGANYIGLNAAGVPGPGNGGAGVLVSSPFARIGSTGVVEQPLRNVISGNAGPGVWVTGAAPPWIAAPSPITISGNRIGTSPDGTRGIGNGAEGVRVENAYRPHIFGNTISANGASGVRLSDTVYRAEIEANRIGTDPTGTAALGNGSDPGAAYRDGITTAAGGLIWNGNVVSANPGAGVNVVSGSAEIRGNHIGTDAAGARPLGIQAAGVRVRAGAGDLVGDNLIGGNAGHGVVVEGSALGAETFISNNQIGARADGIPVPNGGDGVVLVTSATVSDNVISGNAGSGVRVAGGSTHSTIVGNVIGTDRAAAVAVPNGRHGIELAAGAADAYDNVISGNAGHGLYAAAPAHESAVAGNFIGTDRAAARALGNGGSGVYVAGAIRIHIGHGDVGRPGNTIAYNAGDGVTVTHQGGAPAVLVRVISNSIFSNGRLGIDLAGDGVTHNDPGDADTGPNLLQNFPVITRVQRSDLDVRVTLRLRSLPQQAYRMELFASPSPDRSGHGEGKRLIGGIGHTITDAAGVATHTLTFRAPAFPTAEWLTTTATSSDGSTSEFSPAYHSLHGRPYYRPREVWVPPTRQTVQPSTVAVERAQVLYRPATRATALTREGNAPLA